ncbi:hypothetical protein AB0H57_24175 [Micromonospora sp. NPDC050686]|uniref:hypothetical protein n=1 Tax=Micromonospora sp. NPDC050686 TaxID=3154631 RepID=UPI0033CB6AA9
MPAKRSPKKSRKPSPSRVDVTPEDLDTLAVTPLALPMAPVALPRRADTSPPASVPTDRQAGFSGRAQRAGQTRFYAFRRS